MNPVEIIRKKRDGGELHPQEIEFFFSHYQKGAIPDYQAASLLMAIFFHSLSAKEMKALCKTMVYSGKVIDLGHLAVPKVDKHSTGGVGDKTSLILAPIVASYGVAVPMVSGRGLGHTGGTLDKLESIPGFSVSLSERAYKAQLKKLNCALVGQTADIAPLDKMLYALRDVTGTVESIPLIASSIMSKKIASGLDALVLDVKTGRGAFMQERERSTALAKTLISIGKEYKKRMTAFITDMNEPLGYAVGNWLEVRECIRALQGEKIPDLMEVTLALSGEMLRLAGKCKSLEAGIALSQQVIDSGAAYERFLLIAKAQGADISVLIDDTQYPQSKFSTRIYASSAGYISSIDSLEIGLAAIGLGAGRLRKEDAIDPKAGILFHKKTGDAVKKGHCIAEVYGDQELALKQSVQRIRKAISIESLPPKSASKIIDYIR